MEELVRLAVQGAGHVGPVIARLAISAGYPVAIATSGDPEDIALIAELVIPGAHPRWAADAVAEADTVVLAIPLHRFGDVDPALLAGKLVVDAMNYWPASDGMAKAEFWPRWRDIISLMVPERGLRSPPRSRSTGKPARTERCTSAHPQPSRRRSPQTSAPWEPPGLT